MYAIYYFIITAGAVYLVLKLYKGRFSHNSLAPLAAALIMWLYFLLGFYGIIPVVDFATHDHHQYIVLHNAYKPVGSKSNYVEDFVIVKGHAATCILGSKDEEIDTDNVKIEGDKVYCDGEWFEKTDTIYIRVHNLGWFLFFRASIGMMILGVLMAVVYVIDAIRRKLKKVEILYV